MRMGAAWSMRFGDRGADAFNIAGPRRLQNPRPTVRDSDVAGPDAVQRPKTDPEFPSHTRKVMRCHFPRSSTSAVTKAVRLWSFARTGYCPVPSYRGRLVIVRNPRPRTTRTTALRRGSVFCPSNGCTATRAPRPRVGRAARPASAGTAAIDAAPNASNENASTKKAFWQALMADDAPLKQFSKPELSTNRRPWGLDPRGVHRCVTPVDLAVFIVSDDRLTAGRATPVAQVTQIGTVGNSPEIRNYPYFLARSRENQMSLGRDDATRIIRFCLAGAGWGSAVHEDDRCVLKIALSPSSASSPSAGENEARRFEGETFEAALRLAADAGVLKSVCLEKQISFLVRSLPERGSPAHDEDIEPVLVRPVAGEALFSVVTAAVSALVHQVQVERGTSALYLSSGGRLFARELREQWRSTDARHVDLQSFWQRGASTLPASLARQLAAAEPALARLGDGRDQIKSLQIGAIAVIESYSRVNDRLLAIIDDLATHGVCGASRHTALAWMTLLHAKEKTGRERAQLASVFSRDVYFEGQHSTVSALIAAGQSYLHVFAAAAPRPAGELLREKMRSDVADAVARMENIALANRDGGFGIDPETWFSTMTRKMDLFGEVESAVHASMLGG